MPHGTVIIHELRRHLQSLEQPTLEVWGQVTIGVKSELGKGSTFILSIPVHIVKTQA